MDRSPTAKSLFKDSKNYEARSAGIHIYAINKITQEFIDWADIIFVMSEKHDRHLSFLKQNFDLKAKKLYDLDIPDIYKKDDPELVSLLKRKVSRYL